MLSSRFKAPLKLDSDEITARHWWDYGSWLTRLRLVTGEVTACAPRDYGSCLCGVLIRLFHIIQPLFHKKVPLFENNPALFENNPALLKTNRHLLKRRCESRGHESQGRSLISSVKSTHSMKVHLGLAMKELEYEHSDRGHVAYYKVIPLKCPKEDSKVAWTGKSEVMGEVLSEVTAHHLTFQNPFLQRHPRRISGDDPKNHFARWRSVSSRLDR